MKPGEVYKTNEDETVTLMWPHSEEEYLVDIDGEEEVVNKEDLRAAVTYGAWTKLGLDFSKLTRETLANELLKTFQELEFEAQNAQDTVPEAEEVVQGGSAWDFDKKRIGNRMAQLKDYMFYAERVWQELRDR